MTQLFKGYINDGRDKIIEPHQEEAQGINIFHRRI